MYDPYKGLIISTADKEIAFKTEYDPARYNTGDDTIYQILPEQAWDETRKGKLWWDLSTTRYLDYEQGPLDYRRKNWGQLAPGIKVNIYEWTESPVPPESWAGYVLGASNQGNNRPSGAIYIGPDGNTPYTLVSRFNPAKNADENVYYFWVNSPNTIPDGLPFRKLDAFSVSQLISNTNNQGIAWFAPIDTYAFVTSNIDTFINDTSTNLQITFYENEADSIIHKQWLLLRENDTIIEPYQPLWNKMRDSLVGFDDMNLSVPDPTLSSVIIYGTKIRPRQTWFSDRLHARSDFFDKANKILLVKNTTTIVGWNNLLNNIDPLPSVTDYDISVFTRADRNLLDNTIMVGTKVLVQHDELLNQFWSLWQYAGGSAWTLLSQQQYRVSDYWSYIDWYTAGYDSSVRINYTYADIPTMNDNQSIFQNNDVIKVLNNGAGDWSLYLFTTSPAEFTLIASQNGTIEFSTSLSNYDITNETLDNKVSTVTKIIIEALQNNLLEIIEQNSIFFTMVRFVYGEQTVVPWAFKTSLVIGQGDQLPMVQEYIANTDLTTDLTNFFNEAKPYHVQLRNVSQQGVLPTDNVNIAMSESRTFDVGLTYDRITQYTLIPDNANPVDYDISTLSAADRLQLFYAPTEGMPPKVLAELISRSEYGGTILDGQSFYQFAAGFGAGFDNSPYDPAIGGYDFDTSILEKFYDVYINGGDPLGVAQSFDEVPESDSTINIDGNVFVQPYLDEDHPEELVKVRNGDALSINVYTTDVSGISPAGYDIAAYDTSGYDLDAGDVPTNFIRYPTFVTKTFDRSTSTGPYAIGQLPQSKQALFVFKNGGLLKVSTDYTVNWNTSTITMTGSVLLSDTIAINSFGNGGGDIVKKRVFKNTSATTFDMKMPLASAANVYVMVDGVQGTCSVSGTIVTITSSAPSNSTVLIVVFTGPIYSTVINQTSTATGGSQIITLTNPPASTVPPYMTTFVYNNDLRLSPPIMNVYQESVSQSLYDLTVTPSTPSVIRVWKNGSEITSDLGVVYLRFFIDDYVIASAGTNYVVGDAVTISGTGTGATAEVSAVDGSGGITAITFSNNGYDYTGTPTAALPTGGSRSGGAITLTVNQSKIKLIGVLSNDNVLVTLVEENGDFLISTVTNPNDTVTVASSTSGDKIQITTYSEDSSFGMLTESIAGRTDCTYQLASKPYNSASVLVYVDGLLKEYQADYTIIGSGVGGQSVIFPAGSQTSANKIIITYFTSFPTVDSIGLKIFKNIFGNLEFFRISDANSTILTATLNPADTEITVNDATVLGQPDITAQNPGTVFIGDERIIFWSVDTTTPGAHLLKQCMRGTSGTGINVSLPINSIVRDASLGERIPGGYQWVHEPNGLIYSTSAQARFLQASSGSIDYNT